MKIIKILGSGEIESYGENNYLIINDSDAVLIDASASLNDVAKNLEIMGKKPKLHAILLTHAHFDHIYNLSALQEKFSCPVYTNKFGANILKNKNKNLSTMLTKPFEYKDKNSLKLFEDGDVLEFGSIKIKTYLTPGHALDSSVFVIDDNMFTGDTVFKNCIGRVDLVGGDMAQMKISLQRIKDDISKNISTFYPGHNENFDKHTLDTVIDYYLN